MCTGRTRPRNDRGPRRFAADGDTDRAPERLRIALTDEETNAAGPDLLCCGAVRSHRGYDRLAGRKLRGELARKAHVANARRLVHQRDVGGAKRERELGVWERRGDCHVRNPDMREVSACRRVPVPNEHEMDSRIRVPYFAHGRPSSSTPPLATMLPVCSTIVRSDQPAVV